jgi:penicillin amidase
MNLLRAILRMTLGKRLPITSGDLHVDGIESPVAIRRDRYGIPMIEAATELDALFALGFCHGQDRTAQLEVWLRLGRGTLSEVLGQKTLGVDRICRRVGFRHAANQQLPLLTETNRRKLIAYTNGINAGQSLGLRHRPHEFVAIRSTPTPWEPADVLAYGKLQSWFMASNWDVELARLRILLADGPEALKALDPVATADSSLIPHPSSLLPIDRLEQDIAALLEVLPLGGGSNNWVIAPSRTTTGRPILCNDPHLAAQLPAPWYLVSIRTPDWAVAGASFVGSPAIPCGHNGVAAWGVTAGLTDNTDLFLEELHLEGDTWQYRQGDHWLPCSVRREEIRIKGSASVVEEVLSTSRGPIINPILHDTPEAISLRAVWLDPLPMDGWLSAMKARSFADFRAPFAQWPGFPMNLVYADTSGKTAWQLVGQIPIRKRGHGMLPMAGWDDRNGWLPDLVPFEEMPFVEDPPQGYFATANNKPVQKADGPFLGEDFLDDYRYRVIMEELAAREKWDLARAASIQLSVRSIPWREVREIIRSASPRREFDFFFGSWTGEVSADSRAAALFEVFMSTMTEEVAKAKARNSWKWALGNGPSVLNTFSFLSYRRTAHLIKVMNLQPENWSGEGWASLMKRSFEYAMLFALAKRVGTWGQVRPLNLQHLLMSRTPLRSAFDIGPIPIGGDEHTPNHASVLPLDPLGPVKSLPNLRATIDVGEWSNSRFVLAGGQSGNPFSPHYADLLPIWRKGEGVPIAFTEDEMQAATVDELRLIGSASPLRGFEMRSTKSRGKQAEPEA